MFEDDERQRFCSGGRVVTAFACFFFIKSRPPHLCKISYRIQRQLTSCSHCTRATQTTPTQRPNWRQAWQRARCTVRKPLSRKKARTSYTMCAYGADTHQYHQNRHSRLAYSRRLCVGLGRDEKVWAVFLVLSVTAAPSIAPPHPPAHARRVRPQLLITLKHVVSSVEPFLSRAPSATYYRGMRH